MLSQRSPDQINAARAETDRAARDKFASERESYRAEAEAEDLCGCGHPLGWHFRGAGSCLECACMEVRAKGDAEQAEEDAIEIDLAEGDDFTDEERHAFHAALKIGARQERRRIATALTALERDTAPLFVEGTPAARAAAGFVAAVRAVVEGRGA